MKYQFIRICFCWLLLATVSVQVSAQSKKERLLQKKNFYLLYLLEQEGMRPVGQAFETLRSRLQQDAQQALINCTDAACFGRSLSITDPEIESVGNELVQLTLTDAAWKKLAGQLRISGAYNLFAADADTGLVRKAWRTDAQGVNYVLGTYVEGKAPLYPKIDSIGFDKNDQEFRNKIAAKLQKQLSKRRSSFYSLPLQLSLDALQLNGRDEAIRYEPLTAKENAAAYKKAAKINWQSYKYSVILVPGLGPEQPGVKLDPNGAKRCDSAAVRYHAGLAPFLVVSGGHVHPNKTPYCEAIEMKKYMVEVLEIPASAIIIEPHARHTTTNLRNAGRLVYLFKMPSDKPVLIVSDASQTKYINGNMKLRVQKELGYLPFRSIKQLSSTETEYLPSVNSLQINPLDPLDP
ncbi:YdcF family protein [Pseudoflavitalea rhizosphaerae]|uniref:YdcF family protein n=1 Tax=Pseudoflavitalea rhizosphaerae TaxID=1884793 RepID=UPI000F8E6C37|nr:YdcF family protein [Pseudoflavitalea rhizosphaerae]